MCDEAGGGGGVAFDEVGGVGGGCGEGAPGWGAVGGVDEDVEEDAALGGEEGGVGAAKGVSEGGDVSGGYALEVFGGVDAMNLDEGAGWSELGGA